MPGTTRETLKKVVPQRGPAISEGTYSQQLVPVEVNVGLR
jgi:hypothetical protein